MHERVWPVSHTNNFSREIDSSGVTSSGIQLELALCHWWTKTPNSKICYIWSRFDYTGYCLQVWSHCLQLISICRTQLPGPLLSVLPALETLTNRGPHNLPERVYVEEEADDRFIPVEKETSPPVSFQVVMKLKLSDIIWSSQLSKCVFRKCSSVNEKMGKRLVRLTLTFLDLPWNVIIALIRREIRMLTSLRLCLTN